jgi:hypothetical protein
VSDSCLPCSEKVIDGPPDRAFGRWVDGGQRPPASVQAVSGRWQLRVGIYSVLPGTVELIVTRVAVMVPVTVATGMLGATSRESVLDHT